MQVWSCRPSLCQYRIADLNTALVGHYRIRTSTWILTQARQLHAVVADQRPKDLRVRWQIILSEGRHDAAWVEQGNIEPHAATKCQFTTHPVVLDKSRLIGSGWY